MIARFEERHRAVLELIDRRSQSNVKVAGLLIPVITLGCVEFKEIDNGNFVFERTNQAFQPREVDQPLRYALSFALKHVGENRTLWQKISNYWTGRDKEFTQTFTAFCKDRKAHYKKYGDQALLEVVG
jgi:hypothetical protein